MLTDIYLKNFTVVKELHLMLNRGLSVLSGETGAGKSIVIDAVHLCLGARADYGVIRHGETECDIRLCFDLSAIPAAQQWLQHHGYAEENECVITRILQKEGRSRSTINGKPCSSNLVRELSQLLIVIHGQHQSQCLLHRDAQQDYLDHYGKHNRILQDIQQLYQQWRETQAKLEQLQALATDRDQQLDFLRYQAKELTDLNLQAEEWQTLHSEHQQLHQSERQQQHLQQALSLSLEDDHSSLTQLEQARAHLDKMTDKNHAITNARTLLETASIHLREAGDELVAYQQQMDNSPQRLIEIEARLNQLSDIARKHQTRPERLNEVQHHIEEKIRQLTDSETQLAQLTAMQNTLLQNYQTHAQQLTALRKKAAKKISQHITQYMQSLGMQGGEFSVVLEGQDTAITAYGNEKIHFHIRTNPGQAMQTMAKVVSGGELSRISLALQTITAEKENIPTFIFDEIDVGIGGQTAEMVGKLLRDLGKTTQVYCITHLPQVAAKGEHHYQVSKSVEQNQTCTHIELLDQAQRVKELARMISASKITDETLAHARALLTD